MVDGISHICSTRRNYVARSNSKTCRCDLQIIKLNYCSTTHHTEVRLKGGIFPFQYADLSEAERNNYRQSYDAPFTWKPTCGMWIDVWRTEEHFILILRMGEMGRRISYIESEYASISIIICHVWGFQVALKL